jgi:hypothetical protein
MLLVSAALSAGGSYLSGQDAASRSSDIAGARTAALVASLKRQAEFGKEGRGYFDTRMGDYAPGAQDTALTGAQTDRTSDIMGNLSAPTPVSDIPLSASAPNAVKGEFGKRMLSAFQQATDRAKAAGKLGGYGDTWMGNNMGIADTGRRIGTVNNFSRAEGGLLGAQQDFAEIGATRAPSIWGPALSAAGGLAAGAAGRGWTPFATTPSVLSPGTIGGTGMLGYGGVY